MKKLFKSTVSKCFLYTLLVVVLLTSCENPKGNPIKEVETITIIEKSNHTEKGKYFIVAESYCFFSDRNFKVGDTLTVK